jgi:hypothetical protein
MCSNFLFGSKFKNIVSFWENEMAVAMFMKIEGANGESKDSQHKEWTDIESFSWGLLSRVLCLPAVAVVQVKPASMIYTF